MVMYLLPAEAKLYHEEGEFVSASPSLIGRVHNGFNHWFERLRARYHAVLYAVGTQEISGQCCLRTLALRTNRG